MTKEGIDLIKRFEGCRLTAYKCPAGVWTIGYGHTKGVKEGQRISEAEAERMLAEDLQYFEQMVGMMVTQPLEAHQMDALISFAYNCGVMALKGSTLLKRVNANPKDPRIREAFMMWNKAGGKALQGLVKRREAEANLYLTTD